MTCTVCGDSIPAQRLAAMPSARQCVPCLISLGDTPKIKAYDEPSPEGPVRILYTENTYIEETTRQHERMLAKLGDTPMTIEILAGELSEEEFEEEESSYEYEQERDEREYQAKLQDERRIDL